MLVNGVSVTVAEVESMTPDGAILWTAASPQLPRTLFMRDTSSDRWTSG